MTVITENAVDDSIGVTCFRVAMSCSKPNPINTPTGPHKAKTMTPKYTVMLLQIAVMLDPEESQQAPCVL